MYTDPYRLAILKLGRQKAFFNSVTAFLHTLLHSNLFDLLCKL